jgi:hypothetical protein
MVLTVVELSTVKPDVVELSIDVDDEVVLDQIGGNVCGGNEKLVELPSSQITPAALTRRDYHLNIKQWLQQQKKNNIDTKNPIYYYYKKYYLMMHHPSHVAYSSQ